MKFPPASTVWPCHRQSRTIARGRRRDAAAGARALRGFTLLEVIIACAIFFLVAFSVLELVTRGLVAARLLQRREADAGMLAGVQSQTNILIEETESGNFDELYPDMYPDYSWVKETTEIASNGLFRVDYAVVGAHKKRGVSETRMSILLYRPMSPPGSASQAFGP